MRRAVTALTIALLVGVSSADPGTRLRPEGVSPQAEAAIQRGLEYLKRTQSGDGSWRNAGSYGQYPTAMTSLALLALMASGSTPAEGPYAMNIRRGVTYLLGAQQTTGLLTASGEARSMYGHGFAMLALAQAYGSEEDLDTRRKIHRALTKGVKLTAGAQVASGGWNYTPGSRGDEGSVTITQLQALRACRNAGIKVPKSVIDGCIKYITNSQCADGGIAYRAGQRSGARPAISAAAICCLYCAGVYDGDVIEKLLPYVKRTVQPTLGSGHAYYAGFYMAQAMWLAGAEHWKEYGPKMFQAVLARQTGDGSWSDGRVGSTYCTAIACVILQLPYRHLPILNR